MGLILAPNERWSSILHMRVARGFIRLSGVRVSKSDGDLIKKFGNTLYESTEQFQIKVELLFVGLSAD